MHDLVIPDGYAVIGATVICANNAVVPHVYSYDDKSITIAYYNPASSAYTITYTVLVACAKLSQGTL